MRGRTNAGEGIALNATTANKTLVSGQVTAGDFVEYYTESTPYIDQGQNVHFIFTIDDYDIAQLGESKNVLAAFKDGEQKFTYSGYNCHFVGENGNYIIFFDAILGVLGVLSITSNGFNLESSIQTQDTSASSYKVGVAGGENKACYYTVDSDGYIRVGAATISNAGLLSDYVLTETRVNASSDSKYYDRLLYYYNGSFYGMEYRTSRIYPIMIDSENNATVGTYVSSSAVFNRPVYQKDNIVIFARHDRKASSSSYEGFYQIYGIIDIVNFTTGNAITKNLPNNGEILSFIKSGRFLMVGKEAISNIAWASYKNHHYYIPNSLQLCSFDDQTYEIVVLSSFDLDVDYTQPATRESGSHEYRYDEFIESVDRNVACCDSDLVYAQCKTQQVFQTTSSSSTIFMEYDSKLYLYDIENDVLQEPTDKNCVIPYRDGRHPIGVAKTNGNANDVIPIYIPTPSA